MWKILKTAKLSPKLTFSEIVCKILDRSQNFVGLCHRTPTMTLPWILWDYQLRFSGPRHWKRQWTVRLAKLIQLKTEVLTFPEINPEYY